MNNLTTNTLYNEYIQKLAQKREDHMKSLKTVLWKDVFVNLGEEESSKHTMLYSDNMGISKQVHPLQEAIMNLFTSTQDEMDRLKKWPDIDEKVFNEIMQTHTLALTRIYTEHNHKMAA